MRNPLAELLDAAWRGVGDAIGDIRDRVVFEGFFSRHVSEVRTSDALGWTRPGHFESGHDLASAPARETGIDRFLHYFSTAEIARARGERSPEQDRTPAREMGWDVDR